MTGSAVTVDPMSALQSMKEGNARYVSGRMTHAGQDSSRRMKVAGTQAPQTIVVTCADSRLSPEIIFDQGIGDLFVIRVAGNVFDTYSLASAEFAAETLGSKLLVVLGHERCGAVDAAVKAFKASKSGQAGSSDPAMKNLNGLVSKIMPSVVDVEGKPGDFLANAIQRNVELGMADAKTRSILLGDRARANTLKIVGGVYDLDTGRVSFF